MINSGFKHDLYYLIRNPSFTNVAAGEISTAADNNEESRAGFGASRRVLCFAVERELGV